MSIYSSFLLIRVTSLITKYKDDTTPNKDNEIVHQGVSNVKYESKKVPSHVKKAIITPI